MLIEEKDNSDGSMGSPSDHRGISNITWKSSMKALLYKSAKIQQRSMCSNVCQIITPLLCVLFTLIVKIISQQIVTSKVEMPQFPRPFDLPIMYDFLPLNISCKQIYLYNFNGTQGERKNIDELFGKNLKRYCEQTGALSPSFQYKQQMNVYMLDLLKQAQKQQYTNGVDMKAPIPDGTMKFHKLNSKQLDVTLSVNDYRLSEYHRNNGVTKLSLQMGATIVSYVMTTEGLMTVLEKVTRPFLQITNPKEIIFGSYMYMPFDGQDTALIDKTVNVIGSSLYPLGLSLLLPLFLYAIVSEKQERLIEIMRMNGLKLKYYWICTFIFNFTISMITFSLFYIFGYFVLQLTFFTTASPVLIWLVLIGWAIAQISMTNFVQIFIRNGKSATIVGYILSIFSSLVGDTIAMAVYADPLRMPFLLLCYPPFALCRIVYIMGIACSSSGCYNSVSGFSSEGTMALVILYGWFIIFLFSIWLNDQVQQQYGVAQQSRASKIIARICRCLRFKKTDHQELGNTQFEIQMKSQVENTKQKVDSSVYKLNKTISKMSHREKCLVIKELSKKYQTSNGRQDYVALKPFSLAIEQKQIFGLLGPNGAGKTTLISVLTGMYPKTSGNAWINGVEVSMGQANQYIGVCPQFDLLWSSLTVYEHLKFYATLKGVNNLMLQDKILQSLQDVDLFQWKDTPSGELSGGMQRRLSIAIALVGNPSIVFLDEPSSGLDPSHRRRLWDILHKCKHKTSIILTTHLMEEAEALCDRVGIISRGQLRCVGKTRELKQSFGEGYRLHINFINLLSPDNQKLIYDLSDKFKAKIVNQLDSRVIMKVQKKMVLQCVRWLKNNNATINWMVSQPSLYDVFMSFVE